MKGHSTHKQFACCKFIMVALLVATVFSFAIFADVQVANAVVPQNYESEVSSYGLDWQMDELNIDKINSIVSSWFDNPVFDFENVDPVVVAVIDTGINYGHEIFTGKYDENGISVGENDIGDYDVLYRDDDGNIIGKNTVLSSDKDYSSSNYDFLDDAHDMHGTHVAGIIATLIHKLNLEKYIKILPIKAAYPVKATLLQSASSSFSQTAIDNAITFALNSGADVVNMSFSASTSNIGASINSNLAKEAVFVAAAGNDKKNVATYPAGNPNVIGVMNYYIDENGSRELTSTSNYGAFYDICAPGKDIYSADGTTDNSYKKLSGTSMATPIVSFACALTTLKYRLLENVVGQKSTADVVAAIKDCAATTITKSGVQYPVLDMSNLVDGEDIVAVAINVESGDVNQKLGMLHKIDMSLVLLPYLQEIGDVNWYVDGELSASGFSFEFTPQDVGIVQIEAVWTLLDDGEIVERRATQTVKVDYFTLDVLTIRELELTFVDDSMQSIDPEGLENSVGMTIHISFEGAQSVSPSTSVIWFVDGEIVAQGLAFDFVPSDMGQYYVQAKIMGIYTKGVTLKIDEPSKRQKLTVITTVLVGIIGGCICVSAVAVAVRKLKLRFDKKKIS